MAGIMVSRATKISGEPDGASTSVRYGYRELPSDLLDDQQRGR